VSGALAETLAACLLFAVVASAVVRDRHVPESAVALGAALVLVATGVISWDAAWDEAGDLAPTLGFLSAMLVLADLCERDGLFAHAARRWPERRAASRCACSLWCSAWLRSRPPS
jgi:arsenical pump membrane protein